MESTAIYILSAYLFSSIALASKEEPHLSSSKVAELTRNCFRNPTMPSTIFTESNLCDVAMNCRFGGTCWKATFDNVNHGTVMHQLDLPGKGVCRCALHCPNNSHKSQISREYSYVCGTDGRTYDSECALRLASCRCQYPIEVRWRGSCEKGPFNEELDLEESFVDEEGSGSGDESPDVHICRNGVTCKFGAVCDLDSEDGPCLCTQGCKETSSHTVCGSDGRSYFNECFLRQSACEDQANIEIIRNGPCYNAEDRPLPIDLSEESGDGDVISDSEESICDALGCKDELVNPVCGSDGENYANQCSLRHRACKEQRTITALHTGFCVEKNSTAFEDTHNSSEHSKQEEKPGPCDHVYCYHGAVCLPDAIGDFRCSCDDICNKDSLKAHQNSWQKLGKVKMEDVNDFLRKVAQRRESFQALGNDKQENGDDHHFRKKRFTEDERILHYIKTTVCGTDGKTYTNECDMRIQACHAQKTIKVKRLGACQYNTRNDTIPKPATSSPMTTSHPSRSNATTLETTATALSTSTDGYSELGGKQISTDMSETTRLIPVTSVRRLLTESQTKPNVPLLNVTHKEVNLLVTKGHTVRKLPGNYVSNASSGGFTWVIAVILAGVALITICTVAIVFYCKSKARKLSNSSGGSDTSSRTCETVIVVSTNNGNRNHVTPTQTENV